MGTGYTRNDTANNIADGNIINASDFDGEFDAIVTAFSTSGHTHDGTSAEGGAITKLGPAQQLTIAATNITPSTDDAFDIGSSGSEFKDLYLDGVAYLDAISLNGTTITTTAAELNIMDGDTSASTGVTIATTDKFIINDGGTMKQITFEDLETWAESNLDTTSNITTVGALDSGSITSGFGNIDNGSSNITSGGLVKIDVDADADDLTGDSATGRLTIGAGEDLNLYHGGTNSYIVNDTGDLIIDTAGDVVLDANGADVLLKDDGTQYGALTNSSGNLIIKSGTTTALTFSGADVTIAGDLTISGDDLTMGTNTDSMLLIADGTNFNPTAVGDLSEISTVANDDVFLAIDTSGGGLKKITRSTLVSGLAVSGAAIANVVEDTTPQLGGNLDTNSHNILIDDAHFIGDENGNEQIIFQTTSSAVNQFDITNAATGNSPEISATGDDTNISLKITPKGTGQVIIDGNVGVESGLIDLKNGGSVSAVRFYCESANAHYAEITAPAHSDFSGNVTLTLPVTTSTLVGDSATQTLTNKTLTAPKFADAGFIADANGNEMVVFQTTTSAVNALEVTNSATGNAVVVGAFGTDSNIDIDLTPKGTGEVNIAAGNLNYASTAITSTGAELNLVDGSSAGTIVNSKAVIYGSSGEVNATTLQISGTSITSTATELNLMDGDSTVGTTAIADGDGLIINDAGTMRQTTVQTLAAYLDDEITAMPNLVSTGALDSGSITSGFGAIDNGTSGIRTNTMTVETSLLPDASGGADIGSASAEFGDVYIADDKQIKFGSDQDVTMEYDEDGTDTLLVTGNVTLSGDVTVADGTNDFDVASHDGTNGLKLGGTLVTASAAELNYVDGVTSNIQTQLNSAASTGKAIAMAMVFG